MKFSVRWLQEWLSSPVEVHALAEALTMSGSEVESVSSAAPHFQNVVVGQVVTEVMHPDSKRLHCCQVDVGDVQPLQIVCGAPNVRAGLKVAVAMVGAYLPDGTEIRETVLRGQPSQGMICSSRELGLSQNHEGIMELPMDAPVGVNLRQYLHLDDEVMDIAVTPNRGDCLSIHGVAREAAVLFHKTVQEPAITVVEAAIPDKLSIDLQAPIACPRYIGRVIRGINSAASTPIWMQERLRRSGIRSIHPVVDVTNYVMLELGQPLHAFDLACIKGGIEVRLAKPEEQLNLLDGKTLRLHDEPLVIADHQQPLALAGIMGGMASAVSKDTQDIFLESAFFSAISLSLTARRYGLQTDASYRYARGVDYDLPIKAMHRVTELLLTIAGGQPGPVVEKLESSYLPRSPMIHLCRGQIKRLLGIQLSDHEVVSILNSLGMKVTAEEQGWQVQVPSYRSDLTIEVDLIEELARIYGYQRIPAQAMSVATRIPQGSECQISLSRMRTVLVDRGYHEVVTYSFVDACHQQSLDPDCTAIPLANPLSSEMSVMRSNLWPGLLSALKYNLNRQIARLRLFETGLCFLPTEPQWQQVSMLGGIASGPAFPEQWGVANRPLDFFDVKADIELLLALTGRSQAFKWQRSRHPALHPGQSATLLLENRVVGELGALHPVVAKQWDVTGAIYLFQLQLDVINIKQPHQFKAISKFPSVRRDLAFTVDQTIPTGQITQFIQEKTGKLLNNVQIFDVYRGETIEKGQVGIALGLTIQDAYRTLKDVEIQAVVDEIIKGLEHEFNAKLRV